MDANQLEHTHTHNCLPAQTDQMNKLISKRSILHKNMHLVHKNAPTGVINLFGLLNPAYGEEGVGGGEYFTYLWTNL